ncbi:hypothetical protein DQ403_10250 [Stutzerimonas zhaodongensis]|uniref:Uncharacterized protein n=1 Tax=Stutzerimonas zhaodongensis TaxID=1176257 RepID=A0A365PVU8_9GAMM|nr:hypothetical protein DQ403_10250 [Stutzerimonas zhaodongensis]HBM10897.1 hypothetical protein [Pseudomonas sp.]
MLVDRRYEAALVLAEVGIRLFAGGFE